MTISRFCSGDLVLYRGNDPTINKKAVMWVVAQCGEHVAVMLPNNVQTNFNADVLQMIYDTLTGKFSSKIKMLNIIA